MSHYRNQPQSHSHIYRMVRVDPSICPSNGTSRRDEGSDSNDSSAANSQELRSHSVVKTTPDVPIVLDGSAPALVPTTPEPPQSTSEHRVDLIVYYNKVFLPRVEQYVRNLSENSTLASLSPMPARRIPRGTPLKRSLSDKVTVVPFCQLPYIHRDMAFRPLQNNPKSRSRLPSHKPTPQQEPTNVQNSWSAGATCSCWLPYRSVSKISVHAFFTVRLQ
ncbi:hypothetical protein COOONC_05794 [Cooperia oncophora]